MSSSGEYTLRLVCDSKTCGVVGERLYPLAAIIVKPSKMEALATAREAGWMIRHGGKTLCPDDAQKLRDSHWRKRV